ncbi:MAG: amidohydrolase [Devosia sp.]|uniref:amidohydrolase family protein n=1 Tax=Devosia sp. TaxID=1871048 RepID=UPI001AC6D48B|nr:amidohydrolase [Devosia sp.]MBN9317728.1 amidohydrolase [Devosia sp.]
MRILDTHLHLIYPDRFSYPWLSGAPAINKPWHVESYWQEAAPLGIEAALHMEVDVAEPQIAAETEFVLGLDRIVGAIANGRPEHADFERHLERMRDLGKVKGIRRLLQFQPAELSQTQTFVDNIRLLPRYGMSFDICVKSHELMLVPPLIRSCPETQFILDHCGNPKIADGEWESWTTRMERVAELPNVVCKVSGILANVDETWTVDAIRPYVEFVIETFGWDRVVWGSDHPVVTLFADLTKWVNATREIVSDASETEQEKLFWRNAERIYGV